MDAVVKNSVKSQERRTGSSNPCSWGQKTTATKTVYTDPGSHPAVVDIRPQDTVQDPLLHLPPVTATLLQQQQQALAAKLFYTTHSEHLSNFYAMVSKVDRHALPPLHHLAR